MARFVINSSNGKKVRILALNSFSYAIGGLMLSLVVILTASVAVNFPDFFSGLKAKQKLSLPVSSEQRPEVLARYLLEDSYNEELDQKMKLLVEEFVRVRSYEKAIQTKVSVLDTLIQNALELDHTLLGNKESDVDNDVQVVPDLSSSNSLEEGVGGGEWSDVDYSESESDLSRAVVLEEQDTVSTLERSIEVLKNLPIGAPIDGRHTSGFGKRRSPFSRRWHMHRGLDIAVARRSPVLSTADGVVVSAGYMGGYGRIIKVDHGNGIQTVYGHLQKIMVKKGQKVCRGQQIGQVGSSGRSTGPHLHYEVRVNGVPKNPKRFVQLAEFIRLADI